MLRTDFDILIRNRVLVIEGSVSSELQRRLQVPVSLLARHILEDEQQVLAIHQDYARAGANILVSGTADANRYTLKNYSQRERLREINTRAVELAREAARLGSSGTLVFGALGPTGALLRPYGPLVESDYRQVFLEQAELLLNAGVEGLILEGFSSLIEAEQCLQILREVSAAPIIATMTLLEDGRTQFGDTTAECFRSLTDKGADAVGIHGTLGPLEIEGFLARLDQPFTLCVRPNAGYPVRIGKVTTYLSSPEYVAECAELFLERGVSIIGGAAGFTPDHIAKVARALRGKAPVTHKGPEEEASPSIYSAAVAPDAETPPAASLDQKLGKEPILSVELEPPDGLEIDSVIQLLKRLRPLGIDAVNIPENPLARARISSIALAKVIHEQTSLQSIAHVTCRDRNLISLQAELLGAHVLGVNTILALTGDPARVGDYPAATSIFDVDSRGLVEILARMNLGKDFGMNDLGAKTRFNIGVATNPISVDPNEIAALQSKIERGATFIQTQPIFDPALIEPFLRAIESYRIPVIFGVMLVRDYRHIKFLVNEYPGIRIREKDLQRFQKADEHQQFRLGQVWAAELVRELRNMSGGVYLMPSYGDSERVVDVLEML